MSMKDKIKTLRTTKGLSQHDLGEAVGVRYDTICKWERGKIVPSRIHCISLANFFGISLRELMFPGDEDDEIISKKR
ncbi:MAG: helix-turn-helix transcriptional regulator [Synergistaceae bacterium]|nr:helix-turn-helix transcriptional regulator [Synergistaceae bacterium]